MVIRRNPRVFTFRSATIKVSILDRSLIAASVKILSRNPPQNHEEWLQLLQKQESLHNIEAQKWQKLLKNAIEYLRQVLKNFLLFELNVLNVVFFLRRKNLSANSNVRYKRHTQANCRFCRTNNKSTIIKNYRLYVCQNCWIF